jgi:hypothetical protein
MSGATSSHFQLSGSAYSDKSKEEIILIKNPAMAGFKYFGS